MQQDAHGTEPIRVSGTHTTAGAQLAQATYSSGAAGDRLSVKFAMRQGRGPARPATSDDEEKDHWPKWRPQVLNWI